MGNKRKRHIVAQGSTTWWHSSHGCLRWGHPGWRTPLSGGHSRVAKAVPPSDLHLRVKLCHVTSCQRGPSPPAISERPYLGCATRRHRRGWPLLSVSPLSRGHLGVRHPQVKATQRCLAARRRCALMCPLALACSRVSSYTPTRLCPCPPILTFACACVHALEGHPKCQDRVCASICPHPLANASERIGQNYYNDPLEGLKFI